jgi:hypothetical protein
MTRLAERPDVTRRRQADWRSNKRAQGFRQLEVWLPGPLVEHLDQLKNDQLPSRDAVLEALLAERLTCAASTKGEAARPK